MVNLDEVIDISLVHLPGGKPGGAREPAQKSEPAGSQLQINQEKGRVRDPGLEAAIHDAEEMRDKLQVGEERFFRFGLYLTMYADCWTSSKGQPQGRGYFRPDTGLQQAGHHAAGARL